MSRVRFNLFIVWRNLRTRLGFTSTVVLTMSIAICSLVTALTLNYLLLAKPFPYPDQDELYVIKKAILDPDKHAKGYAYSFPAALSVYKMKEVYADVALIAYDQTMLATLPKNPSINLSFTTSELKEILDIPMHKGRFINENEDKDSHTPVAVISYDTWIKHFSSDRNILSKKITLFGVSYNIIGVTDKKFIEPQLYNRGRETGVWLPWDYTVGLENKAHNWANFNDKVFILGKLANNLNVYRAQEKVNKKLNEQWREGVDSIEFFRDWSVSIEMNKLRDVILGDSKSTVIMLFLGVVGLVLVACANLSNLFISRIAEKQKKMAIAAAIGAKKKHLFKESLYETSALMSISICLALLLAQFTFVLMRDHLSGVLPRASELSINYVTICSALASGIIFSLFFAMLASSMIKYQKLISLVQGSGKGGGLQIPKKIRNILITSQITLAGILVLVNSSLFFDAYKIIFKDKGFKSDGVYSVLVMSSDSKWPTKQETFVAMKELEKNILSLSEVEKINRSGSPVTPFTIVRISAKETEERFTPHFMRIDENYFPLIEQAFTEGRNFTEIEVKDSLRVTVINDEFARLISPNSSALGMSLDGGGGDPFKVVGIVKSISLPNDKKPIARMYTPIKKSETMFMIKLKENKKLSRQKLAEIITKTDSRYALLNYESINDIYGRMLFTQKITASTTAFLAIIVFNLAAIGLYGVLSYSTRLRRFEIGARMAVGAKRKHIVKMIVNGGAKLIFISIVICSLSLAFLYNYANEYIDLSLSFEFLTIALVVLILLSLVVMISSCSPLRNYMQEPLSRSIRGGE